MSTCVYHTLSKDEIAPELKNEIIKLHARFKRDCRDIYRMRCEIGIPALTQFIKDGNLGDPFDDSVLDMVKCGYLVLKCLEKGAVIANVNVVDRAVHKRSVGLFRALAGVKDVHARQMIIDSVFCV